LLREAAEESDYSQEYLITVQTPRVVSTPRAALTRVELARGVPIEQG